MRLIRTPAVATGFAPVGPRPGQDVRPTDNWSRRAAVALAFAPMPWIMRLFAFVHFAGIRAAHVERFPRRGPAILVANHPATWADVLVLHVVLARKLHFLAEQHLFRPRVRAWLLRIFGTLPVFTVGEAAEREARNAATFRRCRQLLERGEVVAIFPEGVSETDRSVRRFKTGAARIALAGLEGGQRVPLVPIGIHYLNRVAFRTRVVVSLGEAIPLPPLPVLDPADRAAWIARVTARLEQAVGALILDLPRASLRTVVEELAPLIVAGSASDEEALDDTRRIAGRMADLERERPQDFAAIARSARRHRRMRKALGLAPLVPARVSRARLAALALATIVGAVPAMAGLTLHALPAWITQHVARHFDPTRVTLMRIGVGWVSFTLWYVAMTGVAWALLRNASALAAPFAAAILGAYALLWSDAWRELRARLSWSMACRWRPRVMALLRRERRTLLTLLDESMAPRQSASPLRASEVREMVQ